MRLSALHKSLFIWLLALIPVLTGAAPAPEVVRWSDIQLVDGSVLKAKDLAGKTVVVEFWASWCPPWVGARRRSSPARRSGAGSSSWPSGARTPPTPR
jgi:hypothetical protein